MPRIPPITGKADVPAQHHDKVDQVLKVFGHVRGPFTVMLHSPELVGQMLDFGDFYRERSVVEAKDRSIAILVCVRERQAAYVWSAQVNAARRAGLREEVIEAIRNRNVPAGLKDEEREILVYADQLIRTNRTEQSAFDALLKRHGPKWLVELTVAANYYGILCGLVNAFEVPAPADGDKLPV